MIVEDDKTVGRYFTEILKYAFNVELVVQKLDAFARLSIQPQVDALLLDLVLGNGAGLGMISEFERAFPDVPIVAVSGYNFRTRDVIAAGAQEFVPKPVVSLEVLFDAVTRAIARHKVRRQFRHLECLIEDQKKDVDNRQAVVKEALASSTSSISKFQQPLPAK